MEHDPRKKSSAIGGTSPMARKKNGKKRKFLLCLFSLAVYPPAAEADRILAGSPARKVSFQKSSFHVFTALFYLSLCRERERD